MTKIMMAVLLLFPMTAFAESGAFSAAASEAQAMYDSVHSEQDNDSDDDD